MRPKELNSPLQDVLSAPTRDEELALKGRVEYTALEGSSGPPRPDSEGSGGKPRPCASFSKVEYLSCCLPKLWKKKQTGWSFHPHFPETAEHQLPGHWRLPLGKGTLKLYHNQRWQSADQSNCLVALSNGVNGATTVEKLRKKCLKKPAMPRRKKEKKEARASPSWHAGPYLWLGFSPLQAFFLGDCNTHTPKCNCQQFWLLALVENENGGILDISI